MSWNISIIGKPDNVVKALEDQLNDLTGQSLEEYKQALPSIVGIVSLNYKSNEASQYPIKVTASGHAYSDNVVKNSSLTVKVEHLDCTLV